MSRYCDIVMKGGITSGVVYPLAALELAKDHRFRNIGGTSAGAIAAAAVAAAEFGSRGGGGGQAYEGIATLPGWLGENLASLFQPTRRMRPLFNTLLSAIGGGRLAKVAAPLNGFPLAAIAGLLPGLGLLVAALVLHGDGGLRICTALAGALLLPAGMALAIVASAAWRLHGLPHSYFGICLGNDREGDAANPPLTRWLADLLDELAGTGGASPLTFGDLWRLEEPDGERGVNLQMMTTCLSQGRPYSLPFEAGEEFWFDPEEFKDLFPERIVRHMINHAPSPEREAGGALLRRLPAAEHLPVVVAARMSLSFPLLIAAVPLYALNDASPGEAVEPERCWFSDGGITSNFPIHFFDAPVPRWPTFAIDLIPLAPGRKLSDEECDNVWMPNHNDDGIAEAWVGWERDSRFGQLGAFAMSIFRTAQNWIDNRQMRGAGYRDRIAHVRMAKEEGGMNLNMKGPEIERLSERGACAAKRLSERFGLTPPAGTTLTWDNQRWIRFRTYMALLEQQGAQALRGFQDSSYGGTPMPELNARPPGAPPDYSWDTATRRKLAIAATGALLAEFDAWERNGPSFADGAPRPPLQPWSIPRV